MIAIIDYGVGNLFSLQSSLKYIGVDSVITSDEKTIKNSDRIILPGVGAFGDAIKKLKASGLDKVIKDEAVSGKPLMGICLGIQLLFEKSFEYGEHEGLSLLRGDVIPMRGTIREDLMIPHIGWNSLKIKKQAPILKYTQNGDFVYFVHSFYVDGANKNAAAVAEYGADITAVVAKDNIFGCQFHPEKSGETGLKILLAFNEVN